jgi:hypothetical protein
MGGARCPASARLRRGTSLTRGYYLKPLRGFGNGSLSGESVRMVLYCA